MGYLLKWRTCLTSAAARAVHTGGNGVEMYCKEVNVNKSGDKRHCVAVLAWYFTGFMVVRGMAHVQRHGNILRMLSEFIFSAISLLRC